MAEAENANAGAADALLRQAALARAATLARAGRYADAELALGSTEGEAALDLLARIRAQQGRLAEAQALWLEAARRDPGNAGYRAALGRLAAAGRWSPLRFWLRWLVAVALLLLVGWVFSTWMNGQFRRAAALADHAQDETPAPRASEPLKLNLAIAGIAESVEGRETLLRFDQGLFGDRAALTPEAGKLLTDLGRRLGPLSSRIAVRVIGYCDDRPLSRTRRYHDNRALALARADAVVRHLTATTALPASTFNLQAGVGTPFPNDTPANRVRNRTVEIRVARAP